MTKILPLLVMVTCAVVVLAVVGRLISRSVSSGAGAPVTTATGPPASLSRPTTVPEPTPATATPTTVPRVPSSYETSAHLGADRPVSMAVGGDFLWVLALRTDGGSRVWRVNPATGRSTPWRELEGVGSEIGYGASKVWVLSESSDDVSVIDPSDRATVVTLHAGDLPTQELGDDRFFPTGLAVGRTGVWLSTARGAVRKYDLQNHEPLKTVALPPGTVDGVVAALGYLWVARGTEGVTRIEEKTGREVDTTAAPIQVEGVTFGLGAIWLTGSEVERGGDQEVALTGRGALVRLDPATRQMGRPIIVPHLIYRAVAGGGAMWVTSSDDSLLWKVDPEGNRLVGPARALLHDAAGIAGSTDGLWIGDVVTRRAVRVAYR